MQTTTSRLTSGTEHEIEIIRDFLTSQGGMLASCTCTWQGPIRSKRSEAQQDGEAHLRDGDVIEPAPGQTWENRSGQKFTINKFEHGRAFGVRDGLNFSTQRGILLDDYTLVGA